MDCTDVLLSLKRRLMRHLTVLRAQNDDVFGQLYAEDGLATCTVLVSNQHRQINNGKSTVAS